MTEPCPRCGGTGVEETAETNDQYNRVRYSYDNCRECGGKGIVEVEENSDG